MKPLNLLLCGGLVALGTLAPTGIRGEGNIVQEPVPVVTSSECVPDSTERDRAIVHKLIPYVAEVDSVLKESEGSGLDGDESVSIIDVGSQRIYAVDFDENGEIFVTDIYGVSTSKFGIGNRRGSKRTPLGVHRIPLGGRFGDGQPLGMILKGGMPIGRIAQIRTCNYNVPADTITTRIMRLEGLEPRNSNSARRLISMHGTNEEGLVGVERTSYGCPRMRNGEVIEYFDLIKGRDAYVNIVESLDK